MHTLTQTHRHDHTQAHTGRHAHSTHHMSHRYTRTHRHARRTRAHTHIVCAHSDTHMQTRGDRWCMKLHAQHTRACKHTQAHRPVHTCAHAVFQGVPSSWKQHDLPGGFGAPPRSHPPTVAVSLLQPGPRSSGTCVAMAFLWLVVLLMPVSCLLSAHQGRTSPRENGVCSAGPSGWAGFPLRR